MRWNYLLLAASAAAIAGATSASAAVGISVLSSMPQLVTGEDALVRITGATAAPTVTVGAKDLSSAGTTETAGSYHYRPQPGRAADPGRALPNHT